MRRHAVLASGLLWIVASCTGAESDDQARSAVPSADTLAYDSALARSVGADEIGMRSYVMAFLKRGPNQGLDSAQSAELLRAHLANIRRMADMGKLVLAGPFSDTTELAGIYVFDVATVEEARELTGTDPAVQAGRFVMELHPWYGPAMLRRIPDLNKRVERTSF